jgi:hypothetical protein
MGNLFGTFVGAAQDPHGAEVALLCFSNIGGFAMWRLFTLFRTVSWDRKGEWGRGGMAGSPREHAITCRPTIPLPNKVELPRLV